MSIRVLLVDDHTIMREGLRLLLEKMPEVEVVAEADDGFQAINLAKSLVPDVVVMDVGMPELNGVEATSVILADNPDIKVIALSVYSDRQYILGMLKAGASGYVLKAAAGEELFRAIEAVTKNKKYISTQVADVVIDGYIGKTSTPGKSVRTELGSRERQVLQLLSEGMSSPNIANRLNIAIKTVETHRRNIMKKLNIHSVAKLTKYAIREGLTELGS